MKKIKLLNQVYLASLFMFCGFLKVYGQTTTDCQFIPPCGVFGAQVEWESNANTGNYAALVAGDIDGDSIPEVVANRPGSSEFFIINGATGATEVSFNAPVVPGDGAGIAIGDVDNDGFGEILFPAASRVYAYEHTGVLKFVSPPLPGTGRTVVSLADFDGDGNAEAYVANYIVSAQSGILLASAGVSNSKGRAPFRNDFDQPVAIDALPDAFCSDCAGLELVAGNVVYAVNISAGTMTAVSTAPNGYSDGYTSVADFDQDGDVDALVQGSFNGVNTMYGWDLQTNVVLGSFPTGLSVAGRVNISDLDGDGEVEASFAGRNAIVAVDNDFSQLWRNTTQDFSSGITGTSVFDFCGDGSYEIAYRDEIAFRVYDGASGGVLWSTSCNSATHIENPLILDVDADGQTEMVVSCGSRTFAFESSTSPWLPSGQVWNQHAYFNVNVNADLTIPSSQLPHWLLGDSLTLNTFMNQLPPVDSQFNIIYAAADVLVNSSDVTCSGDTAYVNLEVCNQGDNTFPAGTPIAFYDADPTSSVANILGTGIISGNILVGDCRTESFLFPAGSNTIFAVLNDDGSTPTPFNLVNDFPNTSVGECDFTNNLTSFVPICCPSATINCCADTVICEGSSVGVPVYFSGSAPYTLTYSDGSGNTTVTTNDNPYALNISPSSTTTYTLIGVSDSGSTCAGEVCGMFTVGVNDCSSQNCGNSCFSTDVTHVVLDANGCYNVEMEVSCDNSCNHALSNFSFSIPCGNITSISNSEGWPVVQTNPNGDPNSGLHGWKVDDIQDFCEDQTPSSFVVNYTWCPSSGDCSQNFCGPLVAYKAANCVQYEEASVSATLPTPSVNGGNAGFTGQIMEDLTPESGSSLSRMNAFPNPSSGHVNIRLETFERLETEIMIVDIRGKVVHHIAQEEKEAGVHMFSWTNEEGGASERQGLYFIRIRTGKQILHQRVLIVQ